MLGHPKQDHVFEIAQEEHHGALPTSAGRLEFMGGDLQNLGPKPFPLHFYIPKSLSSCSADSSFCERHEHSLQGI